MSRDSDKVGVITPLESGQWVHPVALGPAPWEVNKTHNGRKLARMSSGSHLQQSLSLSSQPPPGWHDGLEVCTLKSEPSSLGLNVDPAKTVILVSCRQEEAPLCVPSLRWTLKWESRLPAFIGGGR